MKYVELLARSVIVAALALAGVAVKAQDGVTKTSIVLGQSVALTGPVSVLAVPFHQGAKQIRASSRCSAITVRPRSPPPIR